ncbi:hypothetical protein KASHIRA_01250 [Serratia phage vB_SmaM-Kashira]|nr:hypothetical protein KASHIRA_01250 [Serratia phage vB_SmaM-Kashira]
MKGFCLGVSVMALLVNIVLYFSMPSAHASQTMSLVDEYRDGNQKVCVYSDGRNSAEVRKSLAGACPSKHIRG